MNDLMALKSLENGGMSPYEQVKVGYMQSKKPSGVAIAALTVGSVAAVAGITSWIFSPIYANARAKAAQDIATAQNAGTSALLNQLSGLLATERAERVAGDINITSTVNDTQSGSQQGTIANQIENSALAQATAQVMTGLMTGSYSENAQKVQLYSAPQPCGCPGSCGCNG